MFADDLAAAPITADLMITALFLLPQSHPETVETFNYAPLAVGVVLTFAGTWWIVSACKWFLNPTPPAERRAAQSRAREGHPMTHTGASGVRAS
ncbi:hypothetical protein [Streptomyces sp. NPDC001340]